MKFQGRLFIGVAIFFAIADVVYWLLSHDPTGTTALALAIAMTLLVGYYLTYTQSRVPKEELWEDRPDAEVEEAAGELGFFSPYSWWPLALAGSCAVAFIGIPIGWWLFAIGLMFAILSTIGWVFEYYRGEFRH